MFDFRDEESRDRADFLIKNGALIVSAVWILAAGSAFIDKQTKHLDLRNKSLGVESTPTADTQMSATFSNPAWIMDNRLCTIRGQYVIKNTGKLNFRINSVSFQLYKLPLIDLPSKVPAQEVTDVNVVSLLLKANPIHSVTLPVGELIGTGNELQRNFAYIIRHDPTYQYVVVANGKGGLPTDEGDNFGDNDLRHISELATICPAPRPTAGATAAGTGS